MKLRILPLLVLLFTSPLALRAQYVQATTNYVQHFFRLSTQAVPGTVASILETATVFRATSAVRADDSDRADLATVSTWADRSVYSTFSDYSTNATYFVGTNAWMEFIGHTAVVHRIVAENTNFVLVSRLLGYNGPYTPLHYSGTNQSGLPYWQTLGLVVPNGTLTHDPSALTWTLTAETNIYYGIGERVFTNKSESAYSLPVVLHAQPGGEAQGSASLSWGLTTKSPDPVVTLSTLDLTPAFTNASALVAAEALLRISGDASSLTNTTAAVLAESLLRIAGDASVLTSAQGYVASVLPTATVFHASTATSATTVTGPQSNLIAGAVQAADATYTQTVALAGSAVQPGVLATARVDYATSAGTAGTAETSTLATAAAQLGSTGAWVRIVDGTVYVYRVETNTNVIRVVSHSQDYNGPMGPWVLTESTEFERTWATTGSSVVEGYPLWANSWVVEAVSGPLFFETRPWSDLPVLIGATGGDGVGTVIIDWGLQTNSSPIQTAADLETALAAYSPTGHLHAIADVTGLQDALDGKTSPAQATNIAEAAASAALATIPGPGVTTLSGVTPTITGATIYYDFAATSGYTLSVATNAPRYGYSVLISGTNAITLGAGLAWEGNAAITPALTNRVVVVPHATTNWNVKGATY